MESHNEVLNDILATISECPYCDNCASIAKSYLDYMLVFYADEKEREDA